MENDFEPKPLDKNKFVITGFIFAFCYGFLFAIGMARSAISGIVGETPIINLFLPLPELNSPMYLLLPIAGFFFLFFLVDWINGYFKSQTGFSPLLPVFFLALSMAAFYIAIFWYIGNYAQLQGSPLSVDGAGKIFVDRFKTSGYYVFVLAGLLGWATRLAVEKIKL